MIKKNHEKIKLELSKTFENIEDTQSKSNDFEISTNN